jgi:hypothetical protein
MTQKQKNTMPKLCLRKVEDKERFERNVESLMLDYKLQLIYDFMLFV